MLFHPVPVPDGQVLLDHVQDDGPVVGHVCSHGQVNEHAEAVPVLPQFVQGLLAFFADLVEVQAGEEEEEGEGEESLKGQKQNNSMGSL